MAKATSTARSRFMMCLLFDYYLRQRGVVVFVGNTHRDGVFTGLGTVDRQHVVFFFRIREAARGFDRRPVAAVDRIIGVIDDAERVGGVPAHGDLFVGGSGRQTTDDGRSVIDGETFARELRGERPLGRTFHRR